MRTIATKWVALGILLAALLLAGGVSYYASSQPDGLTRVSQDKGFASTQKDHRAADSPLAGYAAKDVDNRRLSGGLAGVVGVVVVLALGTGLAYVVRRRDRRPAA
ncbi:PDGLE domain-containing protein [Nocardioides sp. URHA0020]|uniref:PDGLE domain-containing protein n=1 Tax=Nocardioides sp. URHA0020 TaxID=1380392 RepID=UPI000AB1F65E|nr:PDGLE domain-containing protein [Nocardioides sp. URHA0020]